MVGTRFYRIWKGIKIRIYQSVAENYKYYGARGLGTEWDNFLDFYRDMFAFYEAHSKKYGEKNTTIDRIDNNKGYYKENCRWATWKQQWRDRPQTHKFTYKGLTKTLREWSEYSGVNLKTLRSRIFRGQPISKAIIK